MSASISKRAYARHRKAQNLPGGTLSAVQKALVMGRIRAEADGRIDPERADRDWDLNTDPSRRRGVLTTPTTDARDVVTPPAVGLTEALTADLAEHHAEIRERLRSAPGLDETDQLELDAIFEVAIRHWWREVTQHTPNEGEAR